MPPKSTAKSKSKKAQTSSSVSSTRAQPKSNAKNSLPLKDNNPTEQENGSMQQSLSPVTNYDPRLADLNILMCDYSPKPVTTKPARPKSKREIHKRKRLISDGEPNADDSLSGSSVEESAKQRKTANENIDEIVSYQSDMNISDITCDSESSTNHVPKNVMERATSKIKSKNKCARKPRGRTPEQLVEFEKLVSKFNRDLVTNKAKCMIKDCNAQPMLWKPFNLKRHLKLVHSSTFKQLFNEEATREKQFEIDAFNTIQDAVEMVTVNGMPFSLMSSTGMRGFLDARLSPLRSNGIKFTINRWNIVDEVEKVSNHIQNKLKAEMKGKIINIMLDISTNGTLSVLGINASYTNNCETVCPSLGIVKITERHNAVNIADMVCDILAMYGISLDQVFSMTTDNGKNVVNSARVLDMVASSNKNENDFHEDVGYDESNDEELENVLNNNCDYTDMLNDIAADIVRLNKEIHYVNHIDCSTHTLQLGINDALVESDAVPVFEEAKEICIALRLQIVQIEFDKMDGRKILPPLENSTRWGSRYLMVCSYLRQREYFNLSTMAY